MRWTPQLCLAFLLGAGASAAAQDRVGIVAAVVFYGDDTEFHGPFREGDTLFGAAGRLAAAVELNENVTVTLGVFRDHRFGGGGFERAVPVASLSVTGGRSTFVFGTLPPSSRPDRIGPDREGPHALPPP